DGSAEVTMPAGAYRAATTADGDDWLVLRLAPGSPATGVPSGFRAIGNELEVTATWAFGSTQQHEFDQPLSIVLANPTGAAAVPATLEGTTWRIVRHVPVDGTLPDDWSDGFYTAADGVHVLTRH